MSSQRGENSEDDEGFFGGFHQASVSFSGICFSPPKRKKERELKKELSNVTRPMHSLPFYTETANVTPSSHQHHTDSQIPFTKKQNQCSHQLTLSQFFFTQNKLSHHIHTKSRTPIHMRTWASRGSPEYSGVQVQRSDSTTILDILRAGP